MLVMLLIQINRICCVAKRKGNETEKNRQGKERNTETCHEVFIKIVEWA